MGHSSYPTQVVAGTPDLTPTNATATVAQPQFGMDAPQYLSNGVLAQPGVYGWPMACYGSMPAMLASTEASGMQGIAMPGAAPWANPCDQHFHNWNPHFLGQKIAMDSQMVLQEAHGGQVFPDASGGQEPIGFGDFPPEVRQMPSGFYVNPTAPHSLDPMALLASCPEAAAQHASEPLQGEAAASAVVDTCGTGKRRRRRKGKASGAASHEVHSGGPKQEQPSQFEVRESFTKEECDKLMEQLNSTNEPVKRIALGKVTENFRTMSFQSGHSSRVAQLALARASNDHRKKMVELLKGIVREAYTSPHANYVIQVVIEALPAELSSFVIDELKGYGEVMARHRYGCRIGTRLLEHAANFVVCIELVDEILQENPGELCRHAFAHHVIQSVLEHGSDHHKAIIAKALLADFPRNVMNRNASYVVEKALGFCAQADKDRLVSALLEDPNTLPEAAETQSGCFVVKAILKMHLETDVMKPATRELTTRAVQHVIANRDRLTKNKWARKLFEENKFLQ